MQKSQGVTNVYGCPTSKDATFNKQSRTSSKHPSVAIVAIFRANQGSHERTTEVFRFSSCIALGLVLNHPQKASHSGSSRPGMRIQEHSRFALLFHRFCYYLRFANLKMDANLIPQVIEYLSKKGYTKTEAMLRAESAVQDVESTSLGTRMAGSDSTRYMRGLGM